jgi:hypothetical protein
MAEAEALICRLENAMEFCKSATDSGTKQKASGSGKQDQQQKKGQQKGQQSGGQGGQKQGQKQQQSDSQKKFFWKNTGQQKKGQSSGGTWQAGSQPNPPQSSGGNFHPATKKNDGSGRRGKGRGNQNRPRVAVMVTSDELRGMADRLDRESAQQADVSEPDDSPRQRQGN